MACSPTPPLPAIGSPPEPAACLDLRSIAFPDYPGKPSRRYAKLLDAAQAALPVLLSPPHRDSWIGALSIQDGQELERLAIDLTMDGTKYVLLLHRFQREPQELVSRHVHPWPLAVHVLEGSYQMDFGPGAADVLELTDSNLIQAGDRYVIAPDVWHSVRPVSEETYSIAIRPKADPQERRVSNPLARVQSLDTSIREALLAYFSKICAIT